MDFLKGRPKGTLILCPSGMDLVGGLKLESCLRGVKVVIHCSKSRSVAFWGRRLPQGVGSSSLKLLEAMDLFIYSLHMSRIVKVCTLKYDVKCVSGNL